ncbi:acyl carrier protein [Flavimarina sp. Hel_I_48]|uniref:acyl carrier protein n=1 Tax=Flavimarina sp. Hel_I_48 TaxID=1392488 RepID=UPI0004DF0E6F|nr:acyl carrier protein [Flavimarina sp. Hel_I_48]
MMTQDSYERLKKIILPYLPEDVSVEDIEENSHLINDLNINSTHLVDIVLDIEDAFDITIEDDELEDMDTVAGSLALISEKRVSKG